MSDQFVLKYVLKRAIGEVCTVSGLGCGEESNNTGHPVQNDTE